MSIFVNLAILMFFFFIFKEYSNIECKFDSHCPLMCTAKYMSARETHGKANGDQLTMKAKEGFQLN